MRILVSLSELQLGIAKILPAIPPKSTLPVLEHFLMQVDSLNRMYLTATDQDIIIRTHITIIEGEEGEILVPSRIFNDIIKSLGNKGDLEINVDLENSRISVVKQDFKADIPALPASDYIELPILDDSKFDKEESFVANFTAEELQKLATKTHFAVSSDEFRLAMTGVLFQFKGSYVNAVATDSFRLVKVTHLADEGQYKENLDVIIPIGMITLLKKVESATTVYVYKNSQGVGTQIRFDFEHSTYISRLINEKFPPYEVVIPKNNEKIAIVDKTEILNIIKRVALFANSMTKQIKLRFEGAGLYVSAEDVDRNLKANEQLFCNFNSDTFEISFNFKYLEDAISNIDADKGNEIYLTFSDGIKPALIKPDAAGENLLMLIMPIRIQD